MTVLCYHTVQPGWRSPLAVTPETFAAHCRWLSTRRLVVDMPEAVSRLDRRMRLPRGLSLLTFDDGFASLYDHALPVLRAHALPATVFLVAETLTPRGRVVDWIDPPPATPPATLTLDQVLEMREAGIRFASHSYSHLTLTELGEDECLRDLRDSRALLEDLLKQPVPYLAYPRGRHDAHVRRAAERAGYTHAFSLPEHAEHVGPFAIPRAGVYPDNSVNALRVKSTRPYLPTRMSRAFPAARLIVRGRRHSVPQQA
jgi:peptidoglycan/xylan/chitin deacetylase (PgdA/CDA1 family)